MRLVAVGEDEVIFVQHVDDGGAGGAAELVLVVAHIQRLGARLLEFGGVAHTVRERGLTAAVDAAARARHDLDEIVLLFARLDLFEERLGIFKPGSGGNAQGMSRDEVGRLLDGVGTAYGKEVEHFKVAVQHVRRRSQRRFHDAARRAEDGAAARRGREGVVELFVGQLRKLDARGLDHARKFARRDRRIDFALHFGAVALVLLRRAGDDGDGIEILGTDVVFFAPVRLEERAEHLLGRLAGREVGDHLGILLLHELDPRGAAGGEHGHRLARLDAVDELARLFHDGQVRGHVHVEHFAGTQAADRGDHLALNVGADGHIERLAQRRADGGRREEHDLLGRIRERLPDLVDRGALGERADGAGDDALTAAHAHRFKEGHIERAADMHVEAAPDGTDRVDVLLSARRDAAHAVDALVVVSHHVGRGGIDGQDEVLALESVLVHAVAEGELL